MSLIINVVLILLVFLFPAYSFTDQTTSNRILKKNVTFVDFMNVSITNFGDQERKDQFKDIYKMHFNALVAYLQSDYKETFKKIYESQKKQSALYSNITKNLYIDSSKHILDSLAPRIIISKNSKARQYLTLGYRNGTVGRNS